MALKTTKSLLGLCTAAFVLSGCALLRGQEAPRETYELTAPQSFEGVRGGTQAQILIKAPSALKSIDSDRIVVRPSPKVVTYLAGAQWTDSVPRMVQSKLVAAFENSGRTGATAQPGDGLVIDFQLVSELREFGISQASNSANIEISVKLLSDRTGKVVRSKVFRISRPAAGTTPDAYVEAIDAAFDALARDLIGWVTGAI